MSTPAAKTTEQLELEVAQLKQVIASKDASLALARELYQVQKALIESLKDLASVRNSK